LNRRQIPISPNRKLSTNGVVRSKERDNSGQGGLWTVGRPNRKLTRYRTIPTSRDFDTESCENSSVELADNETGDSIPVTRRNLPEFVRVVSRRWRRTVCHEENSRASR